MVTVANGALLNFEFASSHAITVQTNDGAVAQAVPADFEDQR